MAMKKVKIKSDDSELNAKEVKTGESFIEISNKSGKAKTPFIRPLQIIGLVSIIGIGVAYQTLFNDSKNNPIVKPLLASNANKARVFVVNNEQDTTLVNSNGSKINIPKETFVDKEGKPINGAVEIAYREFHNVGEIILSGIPMTYDSANTQFNFESAGMFEITGTKNGEAVFIKEGKTLEVTMISDNPDSVKFNQYYLDTIAGNWKYIGEDVPTISKLVSIKTISKKDTAEIKSEMAKPHLFNDDRFHFQISVDKSYFPELALYEDTLFEVLPETKNYNPRWANVDWEDAKLERITGSEKYKITFMNGDTSVTILSQVVVGRDNSTAALKAYEKLYAIYTFKQQERAKQKLEKEAKVAAEIKSNQKYIETIRMEAQNKAQKSISTAQMEVIVSRTFAIVQFGIWNSDCPANMPKGQLLVAEFKNKNGEAIAVSKVYLVEKNKNALYDLYEGKKISFNPASSNTLIVISNNAEIGVFSTEDFTSIDIGEKKHVFKLEMNKKLVSPSEIMQMINS